jgi:hypothetical protein
MAFHQPDDIFSPGVDVLGTSQDEQGTILAQTGDVVGETVESDSAEVWQHVGFASRPAKAISGASACQAITLNQGSNDLIIATRDLRGSGIYGTLREGETCLYAPGPANHGTGQILLQDDGTTSTITVKGNGACNVSTATVALGNGASHPVALADALQTWAGQLATWAAAVAAQLPGLPTFPPLPSSAASSTVKASS